MKKTLIYTVTLAVLVILSCQRSGDKKTENYSNDSANFSSHLGTWEMIYFRSIRGADTTELTSIDSPLAITLLTPSHFSYQWRNSANSGAGSYTYDGTIIRQRFEYVQDSSFVGAVLSFNMEVRNDSIIFSGPVEAVSSEGKNLLDQIPQMLEIRTRSN